MRDGYKMTEVGLIPTDWVSKPFFNCFSKVIDYRGRTPLKIGMDWGGGSIPALSANNVKMGKIDLSFPTYFGSDELYIKWMAGNEVQSGDVLMTMEAPLGNIAMIDDDNKYILSQRAIALRPTVSNSSMFMKYNLMSENFQMTINAFSTGTTAKGINQRNLAKLFLPLPPLPEQQKIADILTTVDDHISETEALIEKTKVLKQGLMQQLLNKGIGHTEFKDTEIGRIPVEWEVDKIGNLYEITSSKRVFQQDWRDSGVPFYRTRELVLLCEQGYVENELFIDESMYTDYTAKYGEIKENDLLVSGVGTLGIAYLVKKDDRFYFKDGNILWFKYSGKCNSQYIKYLYQSRIILDQIKGNSTGTTVGTYTIINAKSTVIPLPPLPEQHQISAILTSVDDQIDTYQAKLTSLIRLKTGLMQQLLTGKIRVKV